MNPPNRKDEDTIRTHIDEVGRRLENSVKAVHGRIGEVDKALRERIESRAEASIDRFSRHEKQDERQFNELAADLKEMKDANRESLREVKTDISKVDTKLDGVIDGLNKLALKEATGTGKLAGIVIGGGALVGVIGWLLTTFVVPLITH